MSYIIAEHQSATQEKGTSHKKVIIFFRVEFLPEEMTFFRTGGRKWKKLISSISSAEDLEESGRFGRKWNKWNITNI